MCRHLTTKEDCKPQPVSDRERVAAEMFLAAREDDSRYWDLKPSDKRKMLLLADAAMYHTRTLILNELIATRDATKETIGTARDNGYCDAVSKINRMTFGENVTLLLDRVGQ